MVPVNLRPPSDDGQLGNRFGLVTLLLPVGIANPLARLYEVHRRMEALKRSYQPVIAFALLGLAGFLPRAAQQEMLDLLANKATAVMTNVPGPQEPLYLAGARARADHVLGAAVGRHRHGRVDPLLQRRRAVRADHRRRPRAGSRNA